MDLTPRPSILRSASTGDIIDAHDNATDALKVGFAPLPVPAPRKRKSARALGMAARSEMLRTQAQRRQQQQEDDLAWEDLAQLMKDASNLIKKVVGRSKSIKKETAPLEDPPTIVVCPDVEESVASPPQVQDTAQHSGSAQSLLRSSPFESTESIPNSDSSTSGLGQSMIHRDIRDSGFSEELDTPDDPLDAPRSEQ